MPGLGQASFLGVSCLASSYLCSSLCWRCRCAGWSPQDFIFCPHCLPWGRAGLSGQQWVWGESQLCYSFSLSSCISCTSIFSVFFSVICFWLCRTTLHCGVWASHCGGLSCCGSPAPELRLRLLWCEGSVAPRHVESFLIRDRTLWAPHWQTDF